MINETPSYCEATYFHNGQRDVGIDKIKMADEWVKQKILNDSMSFQTLGSGEKAYLKKTVNSYGDHDGNLVTVFKTIISFNNDNGECTDELRTKAENVYNQFFAELGYEGKLDRQYSHVFYHIKSPEPED
jgi:hypothetical protein